MCFKFNFKVIRWLLISILFMLLDIGSKYWIRTHCDLYHIIYLCPGVNFFYINNAGLVFGLFSNLDIYWYYLLIFMTFIIIMVFIILLYKSIEHSNYINIAYTILIGGSLGNLFDRIIYGVVIDFIDIHVGNWHWPIFNIADIGICIGIMLLFAEIFCCYYFTKKIFLY